MIRLKVFCGIVFCGIGSRDRNNLTGFLHFVTPDTNQRINMLAAFPTDAPPNLNPAAQAIKTRIPPHLFR
jgi:hypothetical protein